MSPFIYSGLPIRVIFGQGTVACLPEEVERLGLRRILVISSSEQSARAQDIGGQLGALAVAAFSGAAMHTPADVTGQAMALVSSRAVDGLVAVGGGSAIGLSKALALRTDLPQIVLPTTYAGSEMTPIIGETTDGAKRTQTTLKVLPEVAIYDVDLTLSLPALLSGLSGLNAIAHAVEALYARDANPVIELMAVDGIRRLGSALPVIAINPASIEARMDALHGAWLCGICLGSVGMALHHKLCHTLGGAFGLPHAATHAIMLPHAVRYNEAAAAGSVQLVAQALEADDAATGLYRLATRLGAPKGLKEIGMLREGIDQATDLACASPYWNPRPLEREAICGLIRAAFEGVAP